MLMMSDLRTEHDVLLAYLDELEDALGGPRPQRGRLAPLLSRLGQLVRIHLLREDELLYPAILSRNDALGRTARRLQEEVTSLGARIAAFEHRWSNGDVAGNWDEFRDDLGDVIAALRTRIALEGDELFPLLP